MRLPGGEDSVLYDSTFPCHISFAVTAVLGCIQGLQTKLGQKKNQMKEK